ncbi:G-protein coupled receptor 4-like [Danio rerio]|uniref:G-protein coupled receptor 4-like n=1 Tax=Danio rerio TaxID=7955 RepID=A0AC58G4K0_DANRE
MSINVTDMVQLEHSMTNSQQMTYAETPAEMTTPGQLNHLNWLIEGLNWTSVKHAFCASRSEMMLIWIIFFIDVLVLSLAICGLCYMLRSNHALPVFVINLFACDIIQICFKPFLHICSMNAFIFFIFYIYIMSIVVNIGFMVCISMERYVMIKYPVWYRLHHTSRNSLLICLFVWASAVGFMIINVTVAFKWNLEHSFILAVFLFLLPYPVVVFSFVGSWRALSPSISVSPDEKKRILRILALVLFSYTVLFMPCIVQNSIFAVSFELGLSGYYQRLHSVAGFLLYLNPLADSLLYVFVCKDANRMLRCSCCKEQSENHV